jgi:hypothetical protein
VTRSPQANTAAAMDLRHATHFRWEEFDRLPRILRDLMNYSPVNVGTGYVYQQLLDGSSVESVARAAVARWRKYAQRQALALYGPTHPQVDQSAA